MKRRRDRENIREIMVAVLLFVSILTGIAALINMLINCGVIKS